MIVLTKMNDERIARKGREIETISEGNNCGISETNVSFYQPHDNCISIPSITVRGSLDKVVEMIREDLDR